jgi:hypothetical protein
MRNQIICAAVVLFIGLFSISAMAQWTTPTAVTAINTSYYEEWTPFQSSDGLSLYFSRLRNISPTSNGTIYAATRTSTSDPFSAPTQVFSSAGAHVYGAWVSPDNLSMYYTEETSGWRLKSSQRASVTSPWQTGTALSTLNSFSPYIGTATLTSDELNIIFTANTGDPDHGSTTDIYTASRTNKSSSFSNITKLSELCGSFNDRDASISPDGLTVIFASDRDHSGNFSLYKATRQSLSNPFDNIQHLSIFDTTDGGAHHPFLSADGSALYYLQDHGMTNRNIYVSYNVPEPMTISLLAFGAFLLRRKINDKLTF